ncbi:MAG: DUF370 domain-containing protein [bacterium]
MSWFLVNIGFGNVVAGNRIVAIINPGSSPVRRLKEQAHKAGKLIDATEGRRTRSIIIMDSDHLILSAVGIDTITARLEKRGSSDDE